MNPWVKRGLIGIGSLVALGALGGAAFAWTQVSAYEESTSRVYDIPLKEPPLSTDPAVLARGKHLVDSVVPCAASDCHGADLAGGKTIAMGPLGTFTGPNVTRGGLGALYTPAELARLLQHGVKKDGRTAQFMPSHDWSWLPPADIGAIVSYWQTLPAVEKPNGVLSFGALAKILDRRDMIIIDIARRVDHASVGQGPAPSATKEYGAFLGRLCLGCHGPGLTGGPIPGAPPDMAVPANLTPHETGLGGWTYEDFDRLLTTGVNKKGKTMDKMMPTESFGKLEEVEKRALFAYLQSLPPKEFGGR